MLIVIFHGNQIFKSLLEKSYRKDAKERKDRQVFVFARVKNLKIDFPAHS